MPIPNSETVQKLVKLHPKEEFLCVKFQICQFWIDNPIFPTEVANATARLPKGKAAGPSGISFDLLKTACNAAPEISEDLANYFQQMVCLKVIPPIELTAARLIALVKPGNGIKPDGIQFSDFENNKKKGKPRHYYHNLLKKYVCVAVYVNN
ncbi:hypothetical protein GEMRC1_006763 [Eukaryota sp. GEM-RC1]